MAKQDESPPKEHLFTVRDPDLGRISFLFYIPECKDKKPLCRRIKEHGGIVVDSPGCCIYQLKPSSIGMVDLNPGLYAQNILYDARWVDDCITVGKLISKKQYIIKDFVGCMKILQPKAPFSIIECLRMYDTVQVRGAGSKGKSRSFWNKVSGTGFFPGRTYESLLNKWKQTLSNYTRSEYAKVAVKEKMPFSSSHAPIPFIKSAAYLRHESSSMAQTEEEEEQKTEERRYIKRKTKNPSDFENHAIVLNLGKEGRFTSQDNISEKNNLSVRKTREISSPEKRTSQELKKKAPKQQPRSNGEDIQASQLSLQALNVIAPKQDRKLKWYEPEIQKKAIQQESVHENLQKSDQEDSMEQVEKEVENLNLDIWTPNLDTIDVGEKLMTLNKRFEVPEEELKQQNEEEEILLRKIVLSDGDERRFVEDELNVSQLDTSGELYEHISQIQENYQDVLKDSQEIYRLIEEFEGNFDEIENTLKARKQSQEIQWSKLEDAVICEAPEDSRMFHILVEQYGEEAVNERKKELK